MADILQSLTRCSNLLKPPGEGCAWAKVLGGGTGGEMEVILSTFWCPLHHTSIPSDLSASPLSQKHPLCRAGTRLAAGLVACQLPWKCAAMRAGFPERGDGRLPGGVTQGKEVKSSGGTATQHRATSSSHPMRGPCPIPPHHPSLVKSITSFRMCCCSLFHLQGPAEGNLGWFMKE